MKIKIRNNVKKQNKNDFPRKTVVLVESEKSTTKQNRNLCEKDIYTKTCYKGRGKTLRLRNMSIEDVRMTEAI